ncbi:hypothetical protein MNBD_GAMMA11-3143 [hydrothermal vent metagenome]|uniref:RDD domain-containing protein n=1 Tax=hydrothermal vent metagenome TaxID=652676 RepID=A0A3B0XH79_9ZZZZ
MNDENNGDMYAPPKAELAVEANEILLASRWSRFFASLLDSLTIMTVTLPTMYFTGGFTDIAEGIEPSFVYNLSIGMLAIFIFFIVNGKFLLNDGQTLGKKALGIKIVDLDGNLPTMKNHLVKRYATYFLPGQVPIVGQFFSFINILFIFGKEKRCIHDHFAGTRVINC